MTEPHQPERDAIIEGARRVAVVGASPNPARPSHGVMQVLLDAGYEVIPVNPTVDEVLGVPTAATLEEVDGVVDVVDVFRSAEHAPEIARSAVAIGAHGLWLQLGIRSDEARRIANDAGMRFVEDACLGTVVDRTRHEHHGGVL